MPVAASVALAAFVGCVCWVIVAVAVTRVAVVVSIGCMLTSLVASSGLFLLAALRRHPRVIPETPDAPAWCVSCEVPESAAVCVAVSDTSPPKVAVFEPP